MSETSAHKADSLLRLISRAGRLEAFPRTGWQVCGIQNPESVAAHSYGVAIIALWLADHIDEAVNTERVLRIALIHDLPEAMLTDLPRPVKKMLGFEACQRAEDEAADRLFGPDLDHWRDDHRRYQDASTPEARIVKAADRIQMLAKALEYRAEHRGRVERFFDDRQQFDDRGFELVSTIFDRLFELYQQGDWFGPGYD